VGGSGRRPVRREMGRLRSKAERHTKSELIQVRWTSRSLSRFGLALTVTHQNGQQLPDGILRISRDPFAAVCSSALRERISISTSQQEGAETIGANRGLELCVLGRIYSGRTVDHRSGSGSIETGAIRSPSVVQTRPPEVSPF
jgi:hypothetical protein